MGRLRGRRSGCARVRVGASDTSLTGQAGVVVLAELINRLGAVRALDAEIGSIKTRDRGVSGGQFLLALAQAQICGQDHLVGLDRCRADPAATVLSGVPIPASTTALGLARRFSVEQWLSVEDGVAELTRRVVGLLPARRRTELLTGPVTVDLDTTDTEPTAPKPTAAPRPGSATTTPVNVSGAPIWPRGPRPGPCWRSTCVTGPAIRAPTRRS